MRWEKVNQKVNHYLYKIKNLNSFMLLIIMLNGKEFKLNNWFNKEKIIINPLVEL